MSFDEAAFLNEQFEARIIDVSVPDLKAWFTSSKPVWKVRGLTGDELGRVNEAVEKYRNINQTVKAIVGGTDQEKISAICESLGVASDKCPQEVIRGIEMLTIGSVEPPCNAQLAIRLNRYFPGEFRLLVKHIQEATLKGHVPGKLKASGVIQESEPASTSATSEEDTSISTGQTSSGKDT